MEDSLAAGNPVPVPATQTAMVGNPMLAQIKEFINDEPVTEAIDPLGIVQVDIDETA